MEYRTVLTSLKNFVIPGDWPPTIFLLPEGAMRDIYNCIVEDNLRCCIELGTGHGATSCVMAAALEEVGGRVTTIDKTLHMPVNANVLKEHTGIGDNLEFVVEPLGYNWYMADLIARQTLDGVCEPVFDFCLLDGAHEFEPDALAFFLVTKLLKPGGWIVLDDINFSLRSMPFWQQTHGHLSDRELDACQIGLVYDYVVKQHPDFTDFRITENGRVGWARKKFSEPRAATRLEANQRLNAPVSERHEESLRIVLRENAPEIESSHLLNAELLSHEGVLNSEKAVPRGSRPFRVQVLYEHSGDLRPHGCSHIRLLLPLTHPLAADGFILSKGTTYGSADVVVVERTWSPDICPGLVEELVECVRRDGACLIYSIDDNLLDMRPEDLGRKGLSTNQLMAAQHFAREADGVIVTTDRLKARLSRFNKNVIVVPNALDERLWTDASVSAKPDTASNRRKIIGYMGTYTHDADLMMILQALRLTLRRHQDSLEFQLIGGVTDSSLMQAFDGLPVRVLDPGGDVEYPNFVAWLSKAVKWDMAIAPLVEDRFNHCKSDLKFLDYSALGIAGIYSRVPAYEHTVRHLETGYLAPNNVDAWVEAFERLLSDDILRQNMAEKAREYVFSSRMLKHRAAEWRNAILSIMSQSTLSVA